MSSVNKSILLVDDDQEIRELLETYLTRAGFQVRATADGASFRQALNEAPSDLVILDVGLPDTDGRELCRRMRKGGVKCPVLMLTGLDDEASINRAYQVGATDFFVKSTQWSLLAGRLRYLLRSARTRIELERSKAKLARAQDLARMGSFDWHRGASDLGMSVEGLRVFGLGANDRVGLRQILRMMPADERASFQYLLHEVWRHGSVLCLDVKIHLHDGRQRIVHLEAEPEFNEHANLIGYTGIVQDVTDRRLAEDQIKHLANFDTLTSLPNRRQLFQRSEHLAFGRALEVRARNPGHGWPRRDRSGLDGRDRQLPDRSRLCLPARAAPPAQRQHERGDDDE